MSKETPTRSQVNFIEKLRSGSKEREEFVLKYLEQVAKDNVSELSVKEASSLIESLKKISGGTVSNGNNKRTATPKQVALIEKMQDSDERKKITTEFMKSHGNAISETLSIGEASDLLDKLKNVKGASSVDDSPSATQKQIKYIQGLQDSTAKIEIAMNYMKKTGKSEFSQLTIKEASALIEILKK
ncbi:MAG: regulatory protein GemA [Candidatus Thermoplasmatota archaeon]|nr:regulatory protein GemA [Candidatus Thermoplasmatota archaeon]MCL5988346.1 regulatory protein GemA [Candidatus Thermoplasmatota archaeon]